MKNDNEKDKDSELQDEAKRLQDQIKDVKQELKEVQDKCRHPKEELSFVEEKDSQQLRVICSVCKKVLRYPGENDLEENGYK